MFNNSFSGYAYDYIIKEWTRIINDYVTYAENIDTAQPLKDYNSLEYVVKRLYIMVTGKQFKHKSLKNPKNRELLVKLTNSAILLLFMSDFREHFADVLNTRMMTPYVPNLIQGVDTVLAAWQEFNLPQYTIYPEQYSSPIIDKTLFTTAIKDKFMYENYGILKLLLASQYCRIHWNSEQKIEAVQTIFDNITQNNTTSNPVTDSQNAESNSINFTMLTKILKFLTKHNTILFRNEFNRSIIRKEMQIIKSVSNKNILNQLKTMPESMWDSIITTNISGQKFLNNLK